MPLPKVLARRMETLSGSILQRIARRVDLGGRNGAALSKGIACALKTDEVREPPRLEGLTR